MAAHFLVDGDTSGPRCACGVPWPCSVRAEALYTGSNSPVYIGLTAKTEDEPPYQYMIGQRAIYQNVIVTVCAEPEHYHKAKCSAVTKTTDIWVDNPERDYKHYVSISNLRPLPNGQL